MSNNIYYIKRRSIASCDYDQARSMVIIAETDRQAREIAACNCGDEGSRVWESSVSSICDYIGKADTNQVPGLVCQDFFEA